MKQFIKDPDALLDYQVDWEEWLEGTDIIIASTWEINSDELVVESNSFTDTAAIVWLSGGVAKSKYRVTNSIETEDGRKDDRSFIIKCTEL